MLNFHTTHYPSVEKLKDEDILPTAKEILSRIKNPNEFELKSPFLRKLREYINSGRCTWEELGINEEEIRVLESQIEEEKRKTEIIREVKFLIWEIQAEERKKFLFRSKRKIKEMSNKLKQLVENNDLDYTEFGINEEFVASRTQ
jgi:hypothetical protein